VKRTLWILVAFVVALVVIGVIVKVVVSQQEDAFFAYLESRHEAGLPVSFADVEGPPPAESENGAPELDAAVKKVLNERGPSTSWKYTSFDVDFVMSDDVPWPDCLTAEQTAEVSRVVATFGPWTKERDAALAKPKLRLPMRLDADGMPTDEVPRLVMSAGRVIGMQASADADPADRLASCRAAFVLAQRGGEGTLVRRLSAMALSGSGVQCLRCAIESGAFEPSAARAACDEFLAGSCVDDVRVGMRTFAVEIIEQYKAIVEDRAVPLSERRTGLNWAEHKFERLWADVRNKPQQLEPTKGMARTIVDVCRGLDAVADADVKTLVSQPESWRLAHGDVLHLCQMDELVARVVRSARRADAQRRLARVALAVAEHRAKRGEFPASLDELKPVFADGVPLDPFTDAPFVYEKTSTGVRVASAGRGKDDPPIEGTSPRMMGLVWELKR
jgi:hypothetical protein